MSHPEGEQIVDVTIEAVRDRFHTLNVPMAYFDGPAGTQVPDSVLEAVSGYLLTANANAGGKFVTSMVTDDVIGSARAAASDLLGVATDEVTFGANMTSLNFALSRTAAREWKEGDEIVVTRLDHDANISPWLELAYDKQLTVHFCEIDNECRIDLDHLRSLVNDRTKVVAFPMASNAVGTITPAKEIIGIAHEAGALAWVDAVHFAPHGDIEIAELGCDVLLCSPYKFFGPHLGLAWVRRGLSESWRPYKVRPQSNSPGQRHETGTLPHELLLGFVACVEYLQGVGWKFINEHERKLGQRFLDGLPDGWTLHGPADDGGTRIDVLRLAARRDAGRSRHAARRRRLRSLGWELLRRRGLQAPRASTTARSGSGSSTRTWRTRSTACSRRCRSRR